MDADLRAQQLAKYEDGEQSAIDGSRFDSVEHLESEWADRIGLPFPGYSIPAFFKVMAIAGVDSEAAKHLSIGEIYEIALHKYGRLSGVEYQPNDREQAAINVIRAAGRRMTGTEVKDKMFSLDFTNASAVAETLGVLVRAQILDNLTDSRGKGYGLKEWAKI